MIWLALYCPQSMAAKRCLGAMGGLSVVPIQSIAAKHRLGAMGVLPDEMVWEILTWLPTKSLMRFKAVSRLWLSAILDPNFARAHRAPFRGLLVMNPDPNPTMGWSEPTRDFYVANLDDDANNSESNNNPSEVNFSLYFRIPKDLRKFLASNILNGLICLYQRNIAKLCNIATREIINLPKSKCGYLYCSYHLGFDPIQSVYKILKICPIYEFRDGKEEHEFADEFLYAHAEYSNDFMEGEFNLRSIECEILTLGVDSSWRSIHPPPNGIIPQGLCVNGVLYWMTVVPRMRHHGLLSRPRYLLYAFNLASEKFQSIYSPDEDLRLLHFGTRPALARCSRHPVYTVSKWPECTLTITDYCEGSWTAMKKYTLDRRYRLYPMCVGGFLPNGSLMIHPLVTASGSDIYLFDEARNYIQMIILRLPASDTKIDGRICWFEENIVSLKCLSNTSSVQN